MFNKKKGTINPEISIENFTFANAKEAIGKDGLACWGYMLYDTKFGRRVALVSNDNHLYSLPTRYVSDFDAITDEEREIVMGGKPLAFREFVTKDGAKTVIASIDGMDI